MLQYQVKQLRYAGNRCETTYLCYGHGRPRNYRIALLAPERGEQVLRGYNFSAQNSSTYRHG